jgi:Leucine-rich repeat (LRR) protein
MKRLFILLTLFISHAASAQDDAVLIDDTAYVYRSLSVALANPDKVYKLNLSKHKLKAFPPDIFKLKNLRDLDLSKNKIDSLPKEIGTMANLERLNLSNNLLTQLPDEIGNLTLLTYLGLNRNEIEALPSSIGNLQNLEVLELWDNELETIPEEITKCKNLKVLELRGILFSDEEHMRIDSLLPEVKVYLSPSCNCKY